MHFMGKLGLEKVSKRSRRDPDHEKTFLTFTLSVNKIILYQFSMFKSLDSIASVVGMFMYLTISKLKQVLRSRKGLGKVSTTTLTCRSRGIFLLLCLTKVLVRPWHGQLTMAHKYCQMLGADYPTLHVRCIFTVLLVMILLEEYPFLWQHS